MPALVALFGIDVSSAANAWLGVSYLTVGWVIASVLFVYAAINHSSNSFVSTAYLSPVMTAILISVFYPQEPVGPAIAGAVLLVVLGNFFLHFSRRTVTATGITSVITLLASVFCVTIDTTQLWSEGAEIFSRQSTEDLLIYAQVIAQVFAIVIGFTLYRLHERNRQLEVGMAEIGTRLYALVHFARAGGASPASLNQLIAECEAVLAAAVDCRMRVVRANSEAAISRISSFLERINRRVGTLEMDGQTGFRQVFEEAVGAVDKWTILLTDRPSRAEVASVYILGVVLILTMIMARIGDIFSNVVTVVFAMAVSFLLAAVGDLLR
ncbi:MAG: hypothetical protein AAFQ99_14040, partial [Pseudomonadota bacterium]